MTRVGGVRRRFVATRFKTDVGVLLQPRPLEAPVAVTRRETSETGGGETPGRDILEESAGLGPPSQGPVRGVITSPPVGEVMHQTLGAIAARH